MIRKGVIAPADISITQNIKPLSVGTLTCGQDDMTVEGLDFIQVFFPDGTYEYYRVKATSDDVIMLSTRALEHSIVWLEDYVCRLNQKFTGTAEELLTLILSYATETKWRLGTVEHEGTVKCELNDVNVMQGVVDVLNLCDGYYYDFDQTGDTWYINLKKMPETAACEGRLSRNLSGVVINVDYHDFATRLYAPGRTWFVDSDTIGIWGVRENFLNVDTSGVSDEELREQCRKYFLTNSNPPVSIEAEANELGNVTGQSFDWFAPGKLCRLCLADYNGAIVTERVNARTYPKLITSPEYVVLSLANKMPSASNTLNGLSVTTHTISTSLTTSFGAVWAGIDENKSIINTVALNMSELDSKILLKADQTEVDELSSSVKAAQLEIRGAQAEIDLRVRKDGVIAAINLSTEEARIAASRIVLDGYVTASQFEALSATITNITSGLVTASVLKSDLFTGNTMSATYGQFDAITHNGELVLKRNITMGSVTGTGRILAVDNGIDLQHSHAVTVNDDGTITLGEVSAEGGNFKIADTKVYKDGVSAAKTEGYEEGRNSIVLEPITINRNGTYTPSDGVDGYNSIVVNVSSSSGVPTLSNAVSGGSSLDSLAYALGTSASNLVRCFSNVQVSNPGYYGFKITAGSNVKYYYFIVV